MCLAVCYQTETRMIITHFTDIKAVLPVQTKAGTQTCLPWGRRTCERGELPLGGWLTVEALKQGKFDYYSPKKVKIPALKFMEQDIENRLRWFDVTAGFWIQGVLLKEQEEQRVYVVVFTPELRESHYLRWPQLQT